MSLDLFGSSTVQTTMRSLLPRAKRPLLITALACLISIQALGQGLAKQGRGVPKVKQLNEEQAKEVIEKFRGQRLKGDFVFFFELVNLPNRGEESSYEGIIWGTWNEKGPLSRVIVWEPGKEEEPLVQVIAQSGPDPKAWIWEPEKGVYAAENSQLFEPLLPKNDYTPFDLLMPFVFWDNFEYDGSKRTNGEPVHQFIMWPPDEIRLARPEFGGAFIELDTRFNYMSGAKLLDAEGGVAETVSIGSFKKVDEQYIVKEINIADRKTKNKSRLIIRGAAVDQKLDADTFDPNQIESIPDTRKIPFKGV